MPRAPRAATLQALSLALGLAGAAAAAPATDVVQVPLLPDEPVRGSADAPLTLVEFTDYQCPYCRRFQAEVWPRLKREWVDTGKLRVVVRDLPLGFHAGALPAAEAAHCAAEQGQFWAMHDALLKPATGLDETGLEAQARIVGLDVPRFRDCVASKRYAMAIARNAALASSLGINGTPAFVMGTVHRNLLYGWALMGARPYEDFDTVLRTELAGGG